MTDHPHITRRLSSLIATAAITAATISLASPAHANHTSGVTVAAGTAYNYFTNVSLFGGPYMRRGYGQVVCDANNQPSGCVPPASEADAASPSVACPVAGGALSATDPNGAKAQYGPAVIFGGKWPEDQGSGPPSGPLTSSIDCRRGVGGSVTSSTDLTLMPIGSAYPGGAGPGPFIADGVQSTCTARADGTRAASATIVNGILETSYYTGDDPLTLLTTEQSGDPKTTETVPANPPVNYTRSGTIDHVGDSYRIVFNEQAQNPDGSISVVAAHMYLLGPTAVGDMVIGASTCGPLTMGPVAHRAVADFDTDGDTDRSVFRAGAWYAEGQPTAFFGATGDVAVPGDYDGDGDLDRAVYRGGAWYAEGQATAWHGTPDDVPVPGDYDGDGDTDRAVFRPSVGAWFIEGQPTVYLGAAGDIAVPGDYDGDGDTDVAVWRPSTGAWHVNGQATQWLGLDGDVPVPGDYDGNGTTDRAVWRPASGAWHVTGQPTQWLGLQGDVPVPGDYDANATTDRAVWRPEFGAWHVDGKPTVYLGATGDQPLPLPAAIRRAMA